MLEVEEMRQSEWVVPSVKHVIALIRVQFCRQIRASMGEVQKRLWRHNDSPCSFIANTTCLRLTVHYHVTVETAKITMLS